MIPLHIKTSVHAFGIRESRRININIVKGFRCFFDPLQTVRLNKEIRILYLNIINPQIIFGLVEISPAHTHSGNPGCSA